LSDSVDFNPLPFADGAVEAVNAAERYVDVRLFDTIQKPPLGGPTKEGGEQAFFAMLWYEGPYGLLSRHYWVERIAPLFGFHVVRNCGEVTFRWVHIRPKPGSGRLTSTWRDGFHVKGNSGKLLWEDCELAGKNDDAFNISTHCSRVRKMLSPTRMVVLQSFPLSPMPWHEGATFAAADFEARTLLGTARIVKVIGWTTDRRLRGKPAASRCPLWDAGLVETARRPSTTWSWSGTLSGVISV